MAQSKITVWPTRPRELPNLDRIERLIGWYEVDIRLPPWYVGISLATLKERMRERRG